MANNNSVIRPGPALIEAAQSTLASKRRSLGVFPYQWRIPGPNSKNFLPSASAVLPAIGSSVTLNLGTVPEGMRVTLLGVVFQFEGDGFLDGSGNLLYTLRVVESGGNRNVEFLTSVSTRMGSTQQPYPILGRLEFQSLNKLELVVRNVGVVVGSDQFVFGKLSGFLYPNSEASA